MIGNLFAGGDDRFEVDSESGIVRTRGRQSRHNVEYELGVSAQDVSAKTLQKSPTHSLKVLVGERDPQFFETQYVANVPESATERYKYAYHALLTCFDEVVRFGLSDTDEFDLNSAEVYETQVSEKIDDCSRVV